MHKGFLFTGSVLGALAVGLGAFGAHGLKKVVPPETVSIFQTGVQYQMIHVFALIITGILFSVFPGRNLLWAGRLFISGIILFSGSLYLLTLMKATETAGMEKLGIITPFGGIAFIAAWLFLAAGVIRKKVTVN